MTFGHTATVAATPAGPVGPARVLARLIRLHTEPWADGGWVINPLGPGLMLREDGWMSINLAPPFQDLVFMTALSEDHADRLVRFAATDRLVVDVGCGWAELLLRVVAASPQSRGLGIDLDEAAIVHGRSLAQERGLQSRIDLVIGDAQDAIPP